MQLKRLILESKNYLYVYHSGCSVEYMHFMGMSRDAFTKAKGSYDVTCFVDTYKTYEEVLEESINEEFSLDKQDRNISPKVTKEECIQCAKEFYDVVQPKFKQTFNGSKVWVLFRKDNPTIGLLFNGESCLYMINSYLKEGLKEGDRTPLGLVKLEDGMLDATIKLKDKNFSLLKRLGYYVDSNSEYGMLEFINSDSNGTNDLIQISNVVLEENYKRKVDSLLKSGKVEYSISYGENVYLC